MIATIGRLLIAFAAVGVLSIEDWSSVGMRHDNEQERQAVSAGLYDARGTLAELFRRHDDDEKRALSMQALKAVIAAEATMKAADAFMLAKTRAERDKAFQELRVACILRLGDEMRRKP